MQWINKRNRKFRKLGHAIVRRFLHVGWNKELNRYVNCKYSDLKNENKMERLLLREQGYKCCYCMRTIAFKHKTTLEHVLPRGTKPSDKNTIVHYLNATRFMKKYVKCTEEPPRQKIIRPPFPHYCAYENLVASCDGSVWDLANPDVYVGSVHNTCNNIRGDKEIEPLFFDYLIERKLIYERDGELTYDEEKYDATIKALNLEHYTLKLIRKFWAQLSLTEFTTDDIRKAVEDDILKESILEKLTLTSADKDFLKRKHIWGMLYDYLWFYNYFKCRKGRIKHVP